MAVVSGLDRYRYVSKLGSGGMATVALADDLLLGRKVALKRLSHTELGSVVGHDPDRNGLSRLRREALLGASVSHPNLVSIYDVVTTDEGDLVIVMEYVPGENLNDRLTREGRLEAADALPILSGVANGLDAIHAQGIVHRDVKPANVLLGQDGAVKLADLGIATMSDRTRITSAGEVLGTFRYMAPEQLEEGPSAPAVDIYALAVVAFEMLSGRKARTESNPIALAHAIATQPPPDLREAWPEAPAPAAQVLMQAMSREPAERPRHAGEMVGRLRAALQPQMTERMALAPQPIERPRPVAPPPADPPRRPAPAPVAIPAADASPRNHAPAPHAFTPPPPNKRGRYAAPPPPGQGRRRAAGALVALALVAAALAVILASGSSSHKPRTSASASASRGTHHAAPASASHGKAHSSTAPASGSGPAAAGGSSTSNGPAGAGGGPTGANTPGATTAPGAAAAPAGAGAPAAATSAGSPISAVESFYHLAASHDYQQAWALADPTFRSQLEGYSSFAAGQAADRSITFDGARVVSQTPSAATVAVQTTSVRQDTTQHCDGTVDLRPSAPGGSWLLHLIHINCG